MASGNVGQTAIEQDPETLAERAEVEATEAEALAAAARARVAELRLRAAMELGDVDDEEPVDPSPKDAVADVAPRRVRRPRCTTVVGSCGIVGSLALVASSGYLVWHHKQAEAQQQREAEFTAAARQIVVTLMSVDSANAQEGARAILDNSTGEFRAEFEHASDDFVKAAKDSTVGIKAVVRAAALQSMSGDTAQVLVTATSTAVSSAPGADQNPRSWRLSLDLARDGGQIKMSKVEFVP